MIHLALIGFTEWLMLAGLLVLLFGSRKLPELGRSLGSSFTEFRRGLRSPVEPADPPRLPEPPAGPDSGRP